MCLIKNTGTWKILLSLYRSKLLRSNSWCKLEEFLQNIIQDSFLYSQQRSHCKGFHKVLMHCWSCCEMKSSSLIYQLIFTSNLSLMEDWIIKFLRFLLLFYWKHLKLFYETSRFYFDIGLKNVLMSNKT